MKAETKYKGSLKLSAIGDALGWITEFEKSIESLNIKYGNDKIQNFLDWEKKVGGRFYGYTDFIREGSYSDDTQLLLCVARSIKRGGRVDNEYFSKIELPNWLSYARGGGRTIKTASKKMNRKNACWNKNFFNYKVKENTIDYRDSGANGAAMRILPIVLANLGNADKIKEEIFCNSIITHGHPRAIIGAILYGYAINQIITFRPEYFNWENFISMLGKDFHKQFAFTFNENHFIKSWLQIWNSNDSKNFQEIYDKTLDEVRDQLRIVYKSLRDKNSPREVLNNLGCFNYETKGSGTATVIAGIYLAGLYCEDPINGIIEAVNLLGTDTDSIAAFTGGLLGALHGQNIIPDKWKGVQDFKYFDRIADNLLAISEDRLEQDPKMILTSEIKSLNDLNSDQLSVDEEIEFVPLGKGKISKIDRQPTLTKGKYNLIFSVSFDIGQSCVFSKLFDDSDINIKIDTPGDTKEQLVTLASKHLKPGSLRIFQTYISKQKKISKSLLKILETIIKNEN